VLPPYTELLKWPMYVRELILEHWQDTIWFCFGVVHCKWKWWYWRAAGAHFINSFQAGTYGSMCVGIMSKIMMLKWNMWATSNSVMTFNFLLRELCLFEIISIRLLGLNHTDYLSDWWKLCTSFLPIIHKKRNKICHNADLSSLLCH
jgi:hypothetical protein